MHTIGITDCLTMMLKMVLKAQRVILDVSTEVRQIKVPNNINVDSVELVTNNNSVLTVNGKTINGKM